MNLLLHELLHVTISLLIASWFSRRLGWGGSLLISLFFGVFLDGDHLFDYGLYLFQHNGWFSLPTFLSGQYFRWSGKFYLLFHAWEWVILMWAVYKYFADKKGKLSPSISKRKNLVSQTVKYLPVAAAALAGHLIIDQLTNNIMPFTYFILYRLAMGFRVESVI